MVPRCPTVRSVGRRGPTAARFLRQGTCELLPLLGKIGSELGAVAHPVVLVTVVHQEVDPGSELR